ncbi:MAG: hypothetical protein GXY44_04750 [Phycisphaerales bacterium]|nr:hypothetical protein [Phycisphaerales bacterium]
MRTVIIGSGNWGITLAGLVNPQRPILLWAQNSEFARIAQKDLVHVAGTSTRKITVEPAFVSALTPDDIVVLVVPSSQIAPVSEQLRTKSKPPYPTIVTASKGLERATFRTMSQVISAIIPEATVAVLSGPTIAREIAEGQPAKAVIGCEDVHTLLKLAKALSSERFHLDMTRDKVDVELCAAMKGVFAVGAGVVTERRMGCNYMGLMLTFGLREIAEIARFLGISTAHVFGVAGMGDLVATCFSPDSRNYQLGQLLARGVPLQQALTEVRMVVEGAMTAAAVSEMAALRLRVPLFSAIAGIVENPDEAAFKRFEQTLLEYPGNG